MSASLNRVELIGNLGHTLEVRYLPDGTPTANVSLATTDRWTDKESGESREATEWHRLVFFGRLAEVAGEYLGKGSSVFVSGKLRTRSFKGKDDAERSVTEVHVREMQMLGGKRKEGQPDMGSDGDAEGPGR